VVDIFQYVCYRHFETCLKKLLQSCIECSFYKTAQFKNFFYKLELFEEKAKYLAVITLVFF